MQTTSRTNDLKAKLSEFVDRIRREKEADIEKAIATKVAEIIEAAKVEGFIATSEDKLACQKHPGAKFKSWSDFFEFNNITFYRCEQCIKESKYSFQCTNAYTCRRCGIVYGDMKEEFYRSGEESWRALCGREGTHYTCSICGHLIGARYYSMS